MKNILIGAALLFIPQAVIAQQSKSVVSAQVMPALSAAAQKTITQVLEQSQLQWIEKNDAAQERALYDQAALEFSRLLDVLTTQVDEATAQQLSAYEGQDIRAKLITIAWYRKLHPDVFATIQREYIFHAPTRTDTVVVMYPTVEPKHKTELYRLAWEYWLLSPPYHESWNGDTKQVIYIVESIHSPASILTLKTLFQQTLQQGVHEAWAGNLNVTQLITLETLAGYPGADGLQALLDCVAAYEARYSKAPARTRKNRKRS